MQKSLDMKFYNCEISHKNSKGKKNMAFWQEPWRLISIVYSIYSKGEALYFAIYSEESSLHFTAFCSS